MTSVSIENALWAAGLLGHAVLFFVLVHRGRARRFPVLTSLIAYTGLQSVFCFELYRVGTPIQMYLYFWRSTAIGYVLQVAFILELAFAVMRSTGILVRQAFKLFLAWSAVGLLAAAILSHQLTSRHVSGWDLWDMRGTFFATSLSCLLYLALLNAVNRWHLPWRSHVMVLGQGFAVWQMVSAVVESAHIWAGWVWEDKAYDTVSWSARLKCASG